MNLQVHHKNIKNKTRYCVWVTGFAKKTPGIFYFLSTIPLAGFKTGEAWCGSIPAGIAGGEGKEGEEQEEVELYPLVGSDGVGAAGEAPAVGAVSSGAWRGVRWRSGDGG